MLRIRSLIMGLGIGAGLMYLLDPDQGTRRRSVIRDKATSLRSKSDEAIETGVRDLRNRAQGVLAEAMGVVSNEPASDLVLAERVRSRLGMVTRHSSAIQVMVQDGTVHLTGDVLHHEADQIVNTARRVRGIRGIENRLNVHEQAGDIPALQSSQQSQNGDNRRMWSPSTRLLAGAGGGLLFLYGAARGGLIGRAVSLAGMGLAVRSAANIQLKGLLGVGEERHMIRVSKSIVIPAPVEEVYNFWNDFTNFSQFMANVKEVHITDGDRSHWVVDGPAGVPVEFDAVVTENIPNEVIAWETLPESYVRHTGYVRFRPMGDGTQLNVRMLYNPPAGVVGHAVASFFGKDPKSSMDEDLARLKMLFGGDQVEQSEGSEGGGRRRRRAESGGNMAASEGGF